MIYITSDSTTDLGDLVEKRGVKVIPLAVVLGSDTFDDGVNVHPSDIYDFVAKTGVLPKTAARSAEEHREFFSSIIKSDDDAIVHFTISSNLSVTYGNACQAAKDFKNVYVVDTQSLSTGGGLLVLHACDLRDQGLSAKEIYEKCSSRVPAVEASFFVETMDYLYKGGRCSGLAKFFAGALKIKPSLLLKDGKITVGKKYRGKAVKFADEYVRNVFEMFPHPDLTRIFITHTDADPEVVEIIRSEIVKRFNFKEILETKASATVTSHCGKGTIGILYINDGE